MQIDGPSTEGHTVFKIVLNNDIVLVEHIISNKTAVLPLAWNRAHPLQRHIVGIEVAGIFNIVPYAIDHLP
ncbi:hypothetical protein D3C75_1275320 [compost metagenome]